MPALRNGRCKRPLLKAVTVLVAVACFLPMGAHAATFPVTKIADTNDGVCDADCSLREAIVAANLAGTVDIITLPAGTYTFTIGGPGEDAAASGDLDITDTVTINGGGRGTTIVNAADLDRVFDIRNGATATLSALTVRDGNTGGNGGGFLVNVGTTLDLTDVMVTSNLALNGAGIQNLGTVNLNDVLLSTNSTTGGSGGGLQNTGTGTLVLVTATGNATVNGGGIKNDGTLNLTDVELNGNTASGGDGGGLYNNGNTTWVRGLATGNSADNGGGIRNSGPAGVNLNLTNVTLSGNNSPTGNGGGIYVARGVQFTNVTITNNTATLGGGMHLVGGGVANLKNTIIANQASGIDCSGAPTSQGYNLDSDSTCNLGGVGDKPGQNPALGALQNNGGPTFTHAITVGSPALDAADNTVCVGPNNNTDQRSFARPVDGDAVPGAVCDMGAFEAEPPPWPLTGTVFEDINYGGGGGRNRATADTSAQGSGWAAGAIGSGAGVVVELYQEQAGSYIKIADTATSATGAYTFIGLANDTYRVRVVNGSVLSNRASNGTGFIPLAVQTFRNDPDSGGAVTGEVGGAGPAAQDAAAQANGTDLATITAQSVTEVVIADAGVNDVDFGFNFDTIVNTNNGGQGSLEQFLRNSNELANAQLAQATLAAGVESSLFMIPTDTDPLGRTQDPGFDAGRGVAVISPAAGLPAITDASTAIDGTTQTSLDNSNGLSLGASGTVGTGTDGIPGTADETALSQVAGPEIELVGVNTIRMGFNVNADNTILRGLAIYGFTNTPNSTGDGTIRIDSGRSGTLIEQCVLGSPATSFTDPGPGVRSGGDHISKEAIILGGDGTVRDNLIGFAEGHGISLKGVLGGNASGWVIERNEIRGNMIGNSDLDAVEIRGSSNAMVEENLIVGNHGPGIDSGGSPGTLTIRNNTITGNGIGAINPGGNPDETAGIRLYGAGNQVDRNVLDGNFGAGVMLTSGVTTSSVTRNSIVGNGIITNDVGAGPSNQIGIDLLTNTDAAGGGTPPFLTPNDPGDGDNNGANNLLNFPAITSAVTAAGIDVVNFDLDLVPAGDYRIEFFKNPSGADLSGNGEGEAFASFKVVNHAGGGLQSYSHSFAGALGDVLTATATLCTDGPACAAFGSTSEFGVAVTTAAAQGISGTVFEDVNYGGGPGRDLASSSGAVVAGATVELYDAAGNFQATTPTNAGGSYLFVVPDGSYQLRVVNSTVDSTRTGATGAEWPVQTYRTDAGTGTAVAVANRVGGEKPVEIDAPANSGAQTLATLNALTAPAREVQSLAPVTVSGAGVTGVDFGFNFNTIVNTNDTGQGSLRQFILNANNLSNSGLAQAGLPAGIETSLFMIPGPADALGRPVDLGWNGTSFQLVPALSYPPVSDPARLDGYTQEGSQPNTVASPGVPDVVLLIEVNGQTAVGAGLTITAASSTVRGLVINRFSSNAISLEANDNVVEGNYLGTDPGGLADLGNGSSGVEVGGFSGNRVGGSSPGERNLISGNGQNGVWLSGSTGSFVQGNYIGTDAVGAVGIGNTQWGVRISGSAQNNTIGGAAAGEGNLISSNGFGGDHGGIRFAGVGATGNAIRGNRIGTDAAGTGNIGNSGPGIRIQGNGVDLTIGGSGAGEGNTIAFNAGDGVEIRDDAGNPKPTSNLIRGNSIFSNTDLGIDLDANGVTGNDAAPDGDNGSNLRQNYPMLGSAAVSGGSTTVTGTLTSALGTTYDIDFYSNPAADVPTGYGEGEVYLGSDTVTTDGTTGAATINTTLPVAVTVGHVVTATATDPDGNTSEFSQAMVVVATNSISGTVYHDTNDDGTLDAGESGIGPIWVKLVQGGSVLQLVQADVDTGAYSLINVADGTYDVIVDDNNNTGDSTPTTPVNWVFRTPAGGLLAVTVAGADVTDRDFGLTFNFDLAADCACGYEDGAFTQVAISIDGDMTDWASIFSDGDNNACDATDATDLDHPVQSTGRNLLRTAVTWDASYFSMWTQRVGQSSNTQNFVYYADTNADGIQQNGEPVVVAKWQGNTGSVVLELHTYDDLGSGGDPVLDSNGFADGYSMPGDLTFVKTLTMPDGSGQGSTTGSTDGTQMEWTIEWTELGVAAGSAIGWHVGSTNSNPGAAGLGAQIDDNLGGCGGQCSGTNQFAGVAATPIGGGSGQTVYAPHTFTNTGNGLDLFDFTWSWTGDFAPDSVTFYRDLGTVGEYDPGIDLPLTDTDADTDPDTGNLGAGSSFDLLIGIVLPAGSLTGSTTVTTVAMSNFVPGCGGTVIPASGSVDDPVSIAPRIVKRAFQSDGTPIASGSTLPSGMPVKFLLYIANHGGALTDASLRDVLDPVFVYQTGTMKVDNTLVASVVCPGGACNEATIFAQVDGSGTSLGDGDAITAPVDADAGSYTSGSKTLDLGDSSNANNAQLNVAADSVWALVFTIRMQ